MTTPLLTFAAEGLRMFLRRLRFSFSGFRRHPGSPIKICETIIRACYDSKRMYFRTSVGHFSQFWTRDFSWCAESLIRLGHEKEVADTLEYALMCFSRHGHVSTTISREGKPYDFPNYAIDSLPLFLHSFSVSLDAMKDKKQATRVKEMLFAYKPFLEEEVEHYSRQCIGSDGRILEKAFSSMKDHAARQESAYYYAMAALLQKEIEALGLDTRLDKMDYLSALRKGFWNGKFFSDSSSGPGDKKDISADSMIIPFWTGLFEADKGSSMLRSTMEALELHGLTTPFPLKYSSSRKGSWNWVSFFALNYEANTVWAHLGMMHLQLLLKSDMKKARDVLESYRMQIEKHGTFLELYNPEGTPFKTPLYVADEGMLWCSIWLDAYKTLAKI